MCGGVYIGETRRITVENFVKYKIVNVDFWESERYSDCYIVTVDFYFKDHYEQKNKTVDIFYEEGRNMIFEDWILKKSIGSVRVNNKEIINEFIETIKQACNC